MIPLTLLLQIGMQIACISAASSGSHCSNYLFPATSFEKTISYANTTRTYGNVDCLDGDVVLIGNYLNLG